MKDDNTDIVRVETEGEIGLICLSKPPVNAIGVALRKAVHDAHTRLLSDPAINAIVLYGEGRFFSAGADIRDFGKAAVQPTLPEVLKALNDSAKPVITVLHGVAFGGALELALATQARVGIRGLKVALPEVKLGLLPGAGGSQRLPRLVGLAAAIDIICTGREVDDTEAAATGIVDRLVEGAPREAGMEAARDVLAGVLHARQTDAQMITPDPPAVDAARAKLLAKRPLLAAPLKALDAVCASTLPVDQGLAYERTLFMDLMDSPERAGLVHAFFAERATAKIPERASEAREIRSVAVIGGGTMGIGIATAFLLGGFPVQLVEGQSDRVAQARAGVEQNLEGALRRGKLSGATHAAALKNLTCTDALEEVASADLIVEAIFEDMNAKTDLFKKLDAICKPGAMLATNTSYLDVNAIAAATSRANDVIGLHFFSPAHIMRLVEVVVADSTAPEWVTTAFALARKIGKVPVRAGVCDGFIGNRILTQYRKASEYLLLDGADFDQIDAALESFGFAMGPFSVSDLAGLDIARMTRQRKAATRPPEERYSRISDLICDQGWFGRKTGKGYYLYDGSNAPSVNPGATEIAEAERRVLGKDPEQFSDEEIVARCLTAMIAEGARALQEGIALRPADIDAVELFGYGFPRHRGGPMHMADQIGIDTLICRIETYAAEDAHFWQVPQLLRDMQKNGQSFADMNA
ncbi:3-hydroxyacyl-CoA dehydrogenase NAD-binding domain-containing protein [Roseovarius arcticus]|uniref:3-hydroxyacyl-CoA dehydrogenase NAD-binding domain-containing protein n=1 Tax=Roseovarius arcticus TaxID=2547404 RepID=UPI0011103F8C|nr:3-hydroxyacyl-CoA dehydrogenase NAD-binding domain-containing protein [Roseovarius arcticus]